MIDREELIKSKEYWLEKIQNTLYLELKEYISKNKLNNTLFANKLGVSKSYLSQVLNGNFDHKLSKLIELSLAIDKLPLVRFENIKTCLMLDDLNKLELAEEYKVYISIGYDSIFSKIDIIPKSNQESEYEPISLKVKNNYKPVNVPMGKSYDFMNEKTEIGLILN